MTLQPEKMRSGSFSGTAAALFLARFFPALALFACWVMASHSLEQHVYGLYQSFWIQLSTFAAVGAIGYPTFIFSYTGTSVFAVLDNIPLRNKLLFLTAIFLMAAVFGYIQSGQELALPAAVSFLSWTLGVLLEATLLALQVRRPIILLNLGYACGMTATHFILLKQGASLSTLTCSIAVIVAIKAAIYTLLFLRKRKQHKPEPVSLSYSHYARQWSHFALNDTAQVLFRWIDKFILSFILLQSSFAVYVNASIDIPFLPILFSAVAGAAVQHWALNTVQQKQNPLPLLHHSVDLLAALVFPLFAFLMAFRREFLIVLFSEQYVSGVSIFVCAQLVLPLRAYPFTGLLQSYKRADLITRGAWLDFGLACALMYPLYRLWGLPGIALAFVISTYWQAIYYLRKTQEITGFSLSELFPVKAFFTQLGLSLLLFFGTYLSLEALSVDTTMRFGAGIILLSLYASIALWRAWRKAA